eukprot:scaffold45928_cov39-Prasinocladus_malaysianus.AAC.1
MPGITKSGMIVRGSQPFTPYWGETLLEKQQQWLSALTVVQRGPQRGPRWGPHPPAALRCTSGPCWRAP